MDYIHTWEVDEHVHEFDAGVYAPALRAPGLEKCRHFSRLISEALVQDRQVAGASAQQLRCVLERVGHEKQGGHDDQGAGDEGKGVAAAGAGCCCR